MNGRAATAIWLLLLTACDRTAPVSPAPDNDTADRALVERIDRLPSGQLKLVLFRAIRDAGHPCQDVAAARRIADQNGRPAWSAQCGNREGRFLLVLSPAGLMNVTPGAAVGQP